MGVPKELNEAAALDGAGPIRTFVSIMLPMAKSTLTSLAIIVFTFSWNDYFTTFIMINDTKSYHFRLEYYQLDNHLQPEIMWNLPR